MCLIVHAPAGKTVDESWLRNFHQRNSDGYGFMWVEDGKLKIYKRLADADHFVEDWNRFVPFERVVHLRMRTHGAIDLVNCHPYIVQTAPYGIALMHNGVLSIGNTSDTTKSDTWHYIEKFLKPMLALKPDLMHEPAFQALVESHIGGSNKFVLMDHTGSVVILNRESGVEWNDLWLSNRYAWDYNRAFPTQPYAGYQGYNRVNTPSYGYQGTPQSWQKQNESAKNASVASNDSQNGTPSSSSTEKGFDEFDMNLIADLLTNSGYQRAGQIMSSTMYRFCRRVGDDLFYQTLDDLLDEVIDEDDFVDCVYGQKLPAARERQIGFLP